MPIRLATAAVPGALLLAIAWTRLNAWDDGAPPAHTGGFGEADCTDCHSGNAPNDALGTLSIDGLPARYRPGARYDLVIALERPALASGGFQLAIRGPDGRSAGTLRATSDRVQVIETPQASYVQHTAEGRKPGGRGVRIHWQFAWTAPMTTTELQLNGAANAANDDRSALGDHIYTVQRQLPAAAD